ncbi:hypothetical protein ILUMI_10281 [Ignelater luminosus]|uniref:Uncharacterized protein n=1 Tax=Ignelater luminosus TaxID=2038154 RepID=A0A8K0D2K1_IGNLU|nr:hypothetical protein ILUMI_10281 [Ignelater luminosus]
MFLLLVYIQATIGLGISNHICVLKARYLLQTSSLSLFCINKIEDPRNIRTLLVEDSKLLTLPKEAFRCYTETTEIYLNNSGIREIYPNAFARNQKLQKLYLNHNNIAKLNAGCFNFLESLEILDISNNLLSNINTATFDDLKNLKVLNLSSNILMKISHLQFNFIENLRILDLSHNMILDINPLLLLKFVKLEKLLINGNQIKRLILRSYDNYLELKLLDASFNQLVYIDTPDIPEMNMNNNEFKTELHIGSIVTDVSKNNLVGFAITSSKSQFFNASYNRIVHLSCNNFNRAQDLKVIDLSHNLIEDIALHTFDTLNSLTECEIVPKKPPTSLVVLLLLQLIQLFQLAYTEEQRVPSTTCIAKADLQTTNKLNFSCLNKIVDLNEVDILLLQSSKLPTLPEDAFSLFIHITEMHLSGSTIQDIHRNAFAGNSKLRKLYLNNNNITRLETGCFHSLDNLQVLDLSRNNLKSLNTFDNLKSLQVLNLSYNYLADVSMLVGSSFAENLRILDLSHNSLKEIYPFLLSNFQNLKRLFVNNNKIRNFTLTPNNNYKIMELVDMSFNQIDYIHTPDFFEINVDNNHLQTNLNLGDTIIHISHNNLPGFSITSPETRFINASWNRITSLNSQNFQKAQELKVFDVSHNYITTIDLDTFDTLTSLTHLNMSHNLLSGVQYGVFDKLAYLEALDLSHNLFKFLYVSPHENVFGFCFLSHLYTANLNDNPWSDSILDRIKTLKGIYSDLHRVITTTEKSNTLEPFLTDLIDSGLDKHEFIYSTSNALKGVELKIWTLSCLTSGEFSPDLNPIEHLWDYMRNRLQNRRPRIHTINELLEALQEEWENVDPDFVQTLIERMPWGL